MTDISVTRTDHQSENRAWYLGTPAIPGHVRSATLDIASFTEASHYPNGFVPSGIVLAFDSVSGLAVPYDDAFDADPATAAQEGQGHDVAAGLLFASAAVPASGANPGVGMLVAFAAVDPDKLPIAAGTAGGGFLDAAGQTDLSLIYFET